MTTPQRVDSGLPDRSALAAAARVFGVDSTDARLLHARSNAVYLLPKENVVARLAPDTPLRRERAETAISVTRWLAHQPGDIALPPLPGVQPILTAGAVATFWTYRPWPENATLVDVSHLLRLLHALPMPPIPVPRYRPLHRLREALTVDHTRDQPALRSDDRAWIIDRADTLTRWFAATTFPLGDGLVHADAHTENLVRDEGSWRLIDWDGCCIGPRELDLISGLPDHFHEHEPERDAFFAAYGYDLRDWPQWTLLRDIAELHSLGSYIRMAPDKPTAADQLNIRVRSLRTGDRSVRWEAIA